MKENITGMKEEREGLESLMDGVMAWLEKTRPDFKVQAELSEAHLLNTPHLSRLIDFENEQQGGLSKEDAEAVEAIQSLSAQFPDFHGYVPTVEDILGWAEEANPEDSRKVHSLELSIARDRLILRNLKRMAEETDDPHDYARLVQQYGRGCMRLCRQIKEARPQPGRIKALLDGAIREAQQEAQEYWRSQPPPMVPGWKGPPPT
jgi:hypothetical protein